MRQLDLRHAFSIALVLFVLGIGALFVGAPQPVRAQLSSVVTWIPASGVSGSNSVALTVPNISKMNDLLGVPLRFFPNTTNVAGGTTINVNTYGAESVLRASGGSLVPIAGGDFSSSVAAEVMWDGTQFEEKNPATGDAPVGSEIVLINAPSSCSSSPLTCIPGYLVENGICISETTYSALYAWLGSSDVWSPGSTGGACSSGQFHVKFANGRASVASNTQGSQTGPLTNCTAGVAETCGAQDQTLATGNIPQFQFTPSGSVSVSGSIGGSQSFVAEVPSGDLGEPGSSFSPQEITINGSNFSWSGSASFGGNQITIGNASPSAITTVPLLNQNIFAVKY